METIKELEKELAELKKKISITEEKINEIKSTQNQSLAPSGDSLSNDEIARYCRQVILPEIGVKGQLALRRASVLVVGAGGLGCPALLYLASAGIGNLGIVDYDEVELNNLHRQTLHTEQNLGKAKAASAKEALLKLNSKCNISVHNFPLIADEENSALRLVEKFDVIFDCTDNVATRYLLNDACVIIGKPLISGSALKLEGQLTVYNYKQGPCYRCIFPTPPPPETVGNCGDTGVLGAVTGVIGSLQAMEAIKIILDKPGTLRGRLLLFDASESTFRNVKLREKRPNCDLCSDKPIIHHLINYEEFCGMRASDKNYSLDILSPSRRVSVQEYRASMEDPHLLIDVRRPIEFEICSLEKAINIPLKDILEDKRLDEIKEKALKNNLKVYVVCRRGNDSQMAVEHLTGKLDEYIDIKDIIGGLHSWHYQCDAKFPIY